MNRENWIDVTRGIAILAVLIGHSGTIPIIHIYIYMDFICLFSLFYQDICLIMSSIFLWGYVDLYSSVQKCMLYHILFLLL